MSKKIDMLKRGFKIKSMTMRKDGKSMWERKWKKEEAFSFKEISIHVPKSILKCKTVAREMVFSSKEFLKDFRIKQDVYFHDNIMEKWDFKIGTIIPNSTNSWEIIFEGRDDIQPAKVLNGNIRFVSYFYEGDLLIGINKVRVFYDK